MADQPDVSLCRAVNFLFDSFPLFLQRGGFAFKRLLLHPERVDSPLHLSDGSFHLRSSFFQHGWQRLATVTSVNRRRHAWFAPSRFALTTVKLKNALMVQSTAVRASQEATNLSRAHRRCVAHLVLFTYRFDTIVVVQTFLAKKATTLGTVYRRRIQTVAVATLGGCFVFQRLWLYLDDVQHPVVKVVWCEACNTLSGGHSSSAPTQWTRYDISLHRWHEALLAECV